MSILEKNASLSSFSSNPPDFLLRHKIVIVPIGLLMRWKLSLKGGSSREVFMRFWLYDMQRSLSKQWSRVRFQQNGKIKYFYFLDTQLKIGPVDFTPLLWPIFQSFLWLFLYKNDFMNLLSSQTEESALWSSVTFIVVSIDFQLTDDPFWTLLNGKWQWPLLSRVWLAGPAYCWEELGNDWESAYLPCLGSKLP